TFQGIVYAVCLLMGQFAQVEPHSAKGRADLVVATGETVYAFEFKAVKDASESRLDEALAQIASRGYLDPWRASGKRLVSVAADYDLAKRELAGWKAA
ncbi:MAG: PD-(D/E)XK nuclease domain-containing protein, partial [Treponema sp.]|nr:PD-(D/E)XK nuclease domain-containing protein [Treponema sp.]